MKKTLWQTAADLSHVEELHLCAVIRGESGDHNMVASLARVRSPIGTWGCVQLFYGLSEVEVTMEAVWVEHPSPHRWPNSNSTFS